MSTTDWLRMSRIERIRALAPHDGTPATCPTCGREVHVVLGYWSQHSDPSSWPGRQPVRQCSNELKPFKKPAYRREGVK